MSFDKQMSETCKACYFYIRALHHIRASLTTEASKTIAAAIVGSRLDFCNSLLAGTSVSNLTRLQRVLKYSCSGGRTKTSVLPHHTCSLCNISEKRNGKGGCGSYTCGRVTVVMSSSLSFPRRRHVVIIIVMLSSSSSSSSS